MTTKNLPLQFSNASDGDGIVETIDELCGTDSVSYPIKKKTRDINLALANYNIIATRSSGRRQYDDPNQEDAPVLTTDINSGQQEYSFTVDEQENQIQDVYKIRIKDPSGNWITLKQRDLYGENDDWLNTTDTGTPTEYDITEDRVIFNITPDYDSVEGMELFVSRTSVYFVSSDTTAVAAIPHIHDEYLTLRPSYFYCLKHGLARATNYYFTLYGKDGKGGMEADIKKYYVDRNISKDEAVTITPESINDYI